MGPYPVNAARYIFGDEPTEVVSAVGTQHPETGFEQSFDDTVAVTLRFPGNRLAQFNLSYYGDPVKQPCCRGTQGQRDARPILHVLASRSNKRWPSAPDKKKKTFKNTDHLGGEM
jgi:predicted dehydrogenase